MEFLLDYKTNVTLSAVEGLGTQKVFDCVQTDNRNSYEN